MQLPKIFIKKNSIRTLRCIRIRLDAPDGIWHVVDLPVEKFCCGFSQASDIDLRHFIPAPEKGPRRPDELCCIPKGGGLKVFSRRKLLIGGVEGRSGILSQGSFLRFGKLKMSFIGFVEESEEVHSLGAFSWRPAVLAAALVLGLAAGLLFLYSVLHLARTAEMERAGETSIPEPGTGGSGTVSETRSEGKTDILFIHAHPDDESIDFGTLMARAQVNGLGTALILFTDGESGIFQEAYSGPRGDLSTLRVAEAERACSILGVDTFMRLSLKNHPYNSLEQELSPRDVLSIWGGEDRLVRQIEILIRRFKPVIVVSPDRPSPAREHFEHEAVGLVVAKALERLHRVGEDYPKAHLVCVDPRQREIYPEATAFPRAGIIEMQRDALKSHATQADASLFAIQMIEEYDYEYYQVEFWFMDQAPGDYFHP